MSYADARAAIESRLATVLAALEPAVGQAFENVPYQATLGTEWVWLCILGGKGNQIELGQSNPLFRFPGIIQATVHVPEETGTDRALKICDEIAAIFRNARFSYGLSGLIRCRVPDEPQRIGPKNGFFRLVIDTPFLRDVRYGAQPDTFGSPITFPPKGEMQLAIGAVDGANQNYTLADPIQVASALIIFNNELLPPTSYSFTGQQSFQLTFPPVAGDHIYVYALPAFVRLQTAQGAMDNVNQAFSLAAPVVIASALVIFNATILLPSRYTFSDQSKFVLNFAPAPGDTLFVYG